MKQKLQNLRAWWTSFRQRRLFVTPREAADLTITCNLATENAEKRAKEFEDAQRAMNNTAADFRLAASRLCHLKIHPRHALRLYKIELTVDQATLETEAGAQSGAVAIATSVAEAILARHNKEKESCLLPAKK